MIILIPGIILSVIAQIKIKTSFAKYSKIKARSGWTADEMSRMFIERYDLNGVVVRPVAGNLTDNYNPTNDVLSLSQSVYSNTSIAALGVAAHECGHARQEHGGSLMMKFRKLLVPVTNVGSRLAVPVAVLGVILDWLIGGSGANFGKYVICFGVALYSLTTIFALVTLPIEIDASRKGLKMLREQGVLERDECAGAKKVLTAAAMTYVASLVVSFLYLLRFIVILSNFRRRDD